MDHEELLLRRARDGDTDAFGGLVAVHRQRVFALAFQILRNEDDALDVAQETFIKAWRSLASFDGRHPLGAWLHRIATNAAIDLVRRRQARPQCPIDDADALARDRSAGTSPSEPPSPGRAMELGELRARLDRALDELSPEHRAVVLLREAEDLSYEEIASRMQTSVGTVMSRLYYARRHLQKILKDDDEL